ncbi:MAG: BatA domain-containing protein [Bacteroidales bacterium]
MQFVNPWFLLGIAGIAVPIIIHLFNFRRFRKVYFTNVRFIEELKLQTQKQSKLKHLLVLFARILAVICLSIAFAQPFKPLNKKVVHQNNTNAVSVYVDNSYSMEARSAKGSLLEEAKNKALETGMAYKPADIYQILTAEFEGKHQRFITREELTDVLNEVKLSPVSRPVSEVIRRQTDLMTTAGNTNKNLFIISDFQKSITDFEVIKADTGFSVFLIPVAASQAGNLYVDSCWFDSPVQQINQPATLKLRIKNTAANSQEKIPVKLMINNTQRALASFDCPARGETEVALSFTNTETGIQQAYLEILDYPLTYDDKFYFSFEVYTTIPVLSIYEKEENQFLHNLFSKDSSFQYAAVPVKSLDFSSLRNYRLIILNEIKQFSSGIIQEMKTFLENGGSVMILPPAAMEADAYNELLSAFNLGLFSKADTSDTKVMKLDAAHVLYRDVFDKIPENLDLPVVLSHYPHIFSNTSGAQVLLKLENDDPFLTAFPYNKGKIYLLSSPVLSDYTNFGKHILFVPTFYKIALLSQPLNRLYYFIGRDDAIELLTLENKGDEIYKIKKVGESYEFIPENRILGSQIVFYPHDQLKEAGNYSVLDGNREIIGVSFNFDRRESEMNFYSAEDLKDKIKQSGLSNFMVLDVKEKPVSMVIEELNKGVRFWKIFVILTLLFLAAEVLILRFWKHA